MENLTYRAKLASFRNIAPFDFRDLPGHVFRPAIGQHVSGGKGALPAARPFAFGRHRGTGLTAAS